jgi:hypothetical protein
VRELDRAMLVALLWWLAAAGAYLAFALSQPAPPVGCSGLACLDSRWFLAAGGVCYGLPAALLGLIADAFLIRAARNVIRHGVVLGTLAALGTLLPGLALVWWMTAAR